ncbi:uncharacterized protein LOC132629989 [Lycium barbarum]|uniref:uncharacterized protein LOC132629989 n=1 Tax=Lycium barbarum TaxID=112863 RepID=UPI00293F13BD|nr:uncharacterized protein LOC132629989 [Lycium barbarum]
MHHVFGEGDAARYMWNNMGNPLGIQHANQPIVNIFNNWWSRKSENNVHKILLKITPNFICWELWKQWCACKHGGQRHFLYSRMFYQAFGHIKAALTKYFQKLQDINHWPTFCLIIEKLRPVHMVKQVTWICPQPGSIKINTDGSYLHKSGRAGIGGIVRNSQGELIMAFSISVNCCNNNMAEALVAEFGVKWCYQHGYTNFTLELDSKVIATMLDNNLVTNMKLKQVLDTIRSIKNRVGIQVSHCFREGNHVADLLAKFASTSNQNLLTKSLLHLPRQARGSFQLDKWQLPSLRCKYDKANFFVS